MRTDRFSVAMAYNSNPPAVVGWSTQALDSGFVEPSAFGTADIICHKSAKNAKAYATVAAGGKVTLQWNTWADSHKGPVTDYLAACNGDCTTVDKTSLQWFKIDGVGLVDGSTVPAKFASDQLMASNVSCLISAMKDTITNLYHRTRGQLRSHRLLRPVTMFSVTR